MARERLMSISVTTPCVDSPFFFSETVFFWHRAPWWESEFVSKTMEWLISHDIAIHISEWVWTDLKICRLRDSIHFGYCNCCFWKKNSKIPVFFQWWIFQWMKITRLDTCYARSELLASEVVWAPVTHESYWQAVCWCLQLGWLWGCRCPFSTLGLWKKMG